VIRILQGGGGNGNTEGSQAVSAPSSGEYTYAGLALGGLH
jgi:hypothetical protein